MRVLISLVMVVLMAGFAFAKMPITDMVDMDLNMRPRLIVDGTDFNKDTGLTDNGDIRTMIGISVMPNENVKIRVRMRETRFLGAQGSLDGPTAAFEAQEAYGKVMGLFNAPLCLTVGRFEFQHGRGRIMGATAWSPFGPRAYDGVHVGFKPSFAFFEVMIARVQEAGLTDRNLVVLSGSMFGDHFQPLFMADVDNVHKSDVNGVPYEDFDRVYTFGFYYHRGIGRFFKILLDGAYQVGTVSDRDLAAFMVTADVYFTFPGRVHPYIGVGFDMTSGNKWDDDPATTDDKMFRSPFWTGHAYRGQMDIFGQEERGFFDYVFHIGLKPENGMKFMLDSHMFLYSNFENASTDPTVTDEYLVLGQEVDFRTIIPLNDNVNLEGGYSIFMPMEEYKPEGDMAHWFYVSSIITF